MNACKSFSDVAVKYKIYLDIIKKPDVIVSSINKFSATLIFFDYSS